MPLTDRLARWQETAPADLAHRPDLIALVQASDYAAAQLARDPTIYATLDPAACPAENYRATYAAEHPHAATEDELMQQLRRYKHRRQVRHIHAVVNGLIDEAAFLARTSALAETLISAALAWQHQALAARYGEPMDADGNPVPMLVLGMGKLGGGELNFSSDIDLIYVAPERLSSPATTALLQRGTQRPVQAILQVEVTLPADDVGEEIAVEGRIVVQQGVQVQGVLGGDQLVEANGPRRDRAPVLERMQPVIRVGAPLAHGLEDHAASVGRRMSRALPGLCRICGLESSL